jgi:hypothetical protein
MNFEEYKQRVFELKDEFEQKEIELMKEFVNSNNPYKAGDRVTDHIGTIVIEKIDAAFVYSGPPCAVYTGTELTKDGIPNKKGKKRQVWQCNLKNS